MRPLVLVVCGDAGGAAAVAPVTAQLECENQLTPHVLAYRYALPAFRENHRAVREMTVTPDESGAEADLKTLNPVLLLTGTTWRPVQPEKVFIAAARAVGVPSLTVLDYWSNYRARFNDEAGALAYLPDCIAIMDTQAREEMLSEGFPAEKLVVTGAPHLDSLSADRAAFGDEERIAWRASHGVERQETTILFASQPLSVLYGDALGYTEQQVLAMLIDTLDSIAERDNIELTLAVRPHPREDLLKFEGVRSRRIRMINAAQGTGRTWAMACDLVVGMNTELLLEACYLGCLTISLQPNLRQPDVLPTNRSRLSLPAYTEHELEPVIRQALFDETFRREHHARLAAAAPPGGATRRVADLIYQMCRIQAGEVTA
jgi:hypothetical protein